MFLTGKWTFMFILLFYHLSFIIYHHFYHLCIVV